MRLINYPSTQSCVSCHSLPSVKLWTLSRPLGLWVVIPGVSPLLDPGSWSLQSHSGATRWHFRREFPCVTRQCSADPIPSCLSPAGSPRGCMASCPAGIRTGELCQAQDGSHQTCSFFVLLGGSGTSSGTEAEPAAELVFPCAPYSYLQKSLCMVQTVWVSSPGSWALQESDCHRQGKKRSWRCRFVRTIIQVGPNSFLA